MFSVEMIKVLFYLKSILYSGINLHNSPQHIKLKVIVVPLHYPGVGIGSLSRHKDFLMLQESAIPCMYF